MAKRIIANNWIKAKEVRLIDKEGSQLGVFSLSEALKKARQAGLDLIQITDKTAPPICKITDYGKYAYQQKKKERKQRQKTGELKNIRLTFSISEHDLETRAKAAEKFLKKGHKIRVEMRLRGRERALQDYARKKIAHFLEVLQKETAVKIEKPLQKAPRGLTMIITRNAQNA